MTDHVRTDVRNGVFNLVLDRPEKKNALTVAMYRALVEALQRAERADVRVVLVHGSGGSFSAGNDLADFVENPPQDESAPVYRFLEVLAAFPKPLLAAVAGPAVGIGTTMLLHCDVVYASPSARFALPFVNLGLCPEAASSYLLPLIVGMPKAGEWLLFGESFDAEEARASGLVNHVVKEDDLLAVAAERAEALAGKPSQSVLLTKRLLRQGHREAVQQTMRTEAGHVLERLKSAPVAEAVQAFFEKRAPDFSGLE